jgi:hypothetical protein
MRNELKKASTCSLILATTFLLSGTAYADFPQGNAIDYNASIEAVSAWNQDPDYYLNNNNSFVINNSVRSNVIDNDSLLVKRSVNNLLYCICEEPAEPGLHVSYSQFFDSLRDNDNYKAIFEGLINTGSEKVDQSIISLLALIPYDSIQPCEESFVINSLLSDNVLTEEYALNAVSLWNNKGIFNRISDIKLKNRFLQKRLDKIISYSGE